MFQNALNWIKERLQERSTKTHIITLLGALTLFGVIPSETATKITTGINAGQEVFHEGRDSVATTIERGTELYEDGREFAEDTRDTALYFWTRLGGLFVVFSSLVGIASKDARQGREYDAREEMLKYKASVMGVDLDNTLPDM